MRLTRIAKSFDDPDYIFELKHDGFRAIAYIEAGECKLVSRNLNHFKSFDHLKKSLDKLPVQNAILDGEVVCLDGNGVSKFNELMSRKGKPVFYPLHLLWFDGEDLRSLPLIGSTRPRRCSTTPCGIARERHGRRRRREVRAQNQDRLRIVTVADRPWRRSSGIADRMQMAGSRARPS
jgi:hypothetical protein